MRATTDARTERDCCEPDAKKYPCDACDAEAVFGALQILIMDFID